MKTLHWKFRALAAGLVLVALGVVAVFFAAAAFVERALRTERRFGNVTMLVHGPSVSPLLAVRADSLVLRSADFRMGVVRPSGGLADWTLWPPSAAALRLRADSIDVELYKTRDSADVAVPFPSILRFPLGVTLGWRVLTVRLPGLPAFTAGPARWRSRGAQALHGTFGLRLPAGRHGERAPDLTAELEARWRGPALHYRLKASRQGEASLHLSGLREKRDLRAGHDSLELFLERPESWSSVPALSRLSDLKIAGKADWRKDSVRFSGGFATAGLPPLEPATWKVAGRLGPGGGRFTVNAAGARQVLRARGTWSHPGKAVSFPDWAQWTGTFSGDFRGGTWKVDRWTLPLDFEIPAARLDTGLIVTAQVMTSDASRIDARWNGRQPGRLEISGDVSPYETWATTWTDTNMSFRAARVEGVWENSRLRATARVRAPRVYGAAADSLEAVNEVTSSGYFLRAGRVHRDGETFTGSGRVLWKNAAGAHEVSLGFSAAHPVHGAAAVTMRVPGPLELTADSLRPARFPYEPARLFADIDPRLHGRFAWNAVTGTGEAVMDAAFAGAGGVLGTSLEAHWGGDSLRVRRVLVTARDSRLEGDAVLPFDGRSWRSLWGVHTLMGGSWNLRASHLNPGDILVMSGRSDRVFRGLVNGALAYSPAGGLAGGMRLDSLEFPVLTNRLQVTGATLTGMGDSLSFDAVFAHRAQGARPDTLRAVFSRLNTETPVFRIEARSLTGISARLEGEAPEWRRLLARAQLSGSMPLGEKGGTLRDIRLDGTASAPLNRGFARDLRFDGAFALRHVSAHDTQVVTGTPAYAGGVLRIPDLKARNGRGEDLTGGLEADLSRRTARGNWAGPRLNLILPGGERFEARDFSGTLVWDPERGLVASAEARMGFLALPASPYRVETGFENLRADVTIPPARASEAPSALKLRARLHDFLFQRKWGWRDATAFFTGFNNRGGARAAATGRGNPARARPWDLDVALEAAGTRNRVDTDVLRMNFTGDARFTGAYPYMLVKGKVSGLQGEIGQTRQAYVLRDFEAKWDNVTLEDGTLYVEGEKKLRTDCRADTRQTCQIYVRLDGRLEDVGFTYDTDCGQNAGEPVPPSVLINSMAQGCYVSETPGGEGNYGGAAFAMLEPALSARLSREFARGSGGFIKSTQVSGLGALVGSDSTGLEAVSLDVESREVYRVGLKGRAGYHPETKLANPMEYRMAAEYRPPLERLAADSAWRARLKDRFTVEAAVETRPEGRDVEEERQVSQRAGLRYRHRFWNLW